MSEECYVYVITHPEHGSAPVPVKVGISDNPLGLFRALQTATPYTLYLCGSWKLPNRRTALQVEGAYHKLNESRRLSGEWFLTWPTGACCEVEELCVVKLLDRGHSLANIRKQAAIIGINAENLEDILFNSRLAYEYGLVEAAP